LKEPAIVKRIVFLVSVFSIVCLLTLAPSVVAVAADSSSGVLTAPDGKELAVYQSGSKTLSSSAAYTWWYGCSATSAGMMMGYYDRNGYSGLQYPNLIAGGVASTTIGVKEKAAIASSRHISDYYSGGYNGSGDDVSGAPTGSLNCLADFMGTNQDAYGNANGGTTFYFYTDGSPITVADLYSYGSTYYNADGMYGMYEYVKNYCGYDLGAASACTSTYSQYIYGYDGNTLGFTWAQYVAEVNAGRPVLIQVEGHTMLGYGYNDSSGQQSIVLYDTWDTSSHTMTWGGSYSGLEMYGVTCLTLQGGVPEPSTIVLLGMAGLTGMITFVRRRRSR
jgi:hypothetical protein